jgi:hypothetical protein
LIKQILTCFLILLFACSPTKDVSNSNHLPAEPGPIIKDPLPKQSGFAGDACYPKMPKLMQSSCQPGLVCVPQGIDKKQGICLMDCGKNLDGRLVKRESACPPHQRCMLLKDHELSSMGMFCLAPQKERDQRCSAPFDDNACSGGLTCLPTASFEDGRGKTIYGLYRCKQECSVEKPCNNVQEACVYNEHVRLQKQPANDGLKPVQRCPVSACRDHYITCPCDRAKGYYCEKLMDGLDMGNCVRKLGVCGRWEA